jgi:hypothetical protein
LVATNLRLIVDVLLRDSNHPKAIDLELRNSNLVNVHSCICHRIDGSHDNCYDTAEHGNQSASSQLRPQADNLKLQAAHNPEIGKEYYW